MHAHPFLMVLDDVWPTPNDRAGQARVVTALRAINAPSCAFLLTTCHEDIAQRFDHQYRSIRELSEDQAVALLQDQIAQSATLQPAALRFIARRVGGLPLALTLIAAFLTIRRRDPAFTNQALD